MYFLYANKKSMVFHLPLLKKLINDVDLWYWFHLNQTIRTERNSCIPQNNYGFHCTNFYERQLLSIILCTSLVPNFVQIGLIHTDHLHITMTIFVSQPFSAGSLSNKIFVILWPKCYFILIYYQCNLVWDLFQELNRLWEFSVIFLLNSQISV
jgi:hypothetical protein